MINLGNNNKIKENENKKERENPKTELTFAYSFEDSMSQELTESNGNDGIHDEERECQNNEQLYTQHRILVSPMNGTLSQI